MTRTARKIGKENYIRAGIFAWLLCLYYSVPTVAIKVAVMEAFETPPLKYIFVQSMPRLEKGS